MKHGSGMRKHEHEHEHGSMEAYGSMNMGSMET
jgi:hypothetical protein